jgi:hypothetical protein
LLGVLYLLSPIGEPRRKAGISLCSTRSAAALLMFAFEFSDFVIVSRAIIPALALRAPVCHYFFLGVGLLYKKIENDIKKKD